MQDYEDQRPFEKNAKNVQTISVPFPVQRTLANQNIGRKVKKYDSGNFSFR